MDTTINPDNNPVINPVINSDNNNNTNSANIKKNEIPAVDANNISVKPFIKGVTKYEGIFTPAFIRNRLPNRLRANINSTELNLLSYEYDAGFRALENCNLFFIAIGAIGAATAAAGVTVATGGAGIIPIIALVAFAPTIGRCAQLFPAQWYKSSELQYICSACLSMVTNMQEDLIKLKKFYQIVTILEAKHVEANTTDIIDLNGHSFHEYAQPDGLYAPVERNLYKFMFILLDAIDFNNSKEELGTLQYYFIIGLFKYCDFKNTRYIVDTSGNNPMLTDAEKKSRMTGEFKFRYTYNNCKFDPNNTNGFKDYNIKHKLYKTTDYAESCNNYNDVIMRMLHDKFLKAKDVLNKIRTILEDTQQQLLKVDPDVKGLITEFLTSANNLANKSSTSGFRFFNKVKSTLIGSPTQKYREMLREYVIMTGNWSMIISKYSVQYNEFILLAGEERYKTELQLIDKNLLVIEKNLKDNINTVIIDNTNNNTTIDPVISANNNDDDSSSSRPPVGGRPKTKRQYKRKNKTKKQIKQVYRTKTYVGSVR